MDDSPRLRLLIVGVVGLSLFAALLARLWYLQVLNAPEFQAQALQNQIREVNLPAARGRILDRNGVVLVDNRASNVVAVDRSRLTANDRPALLNALSAVLHVPAKTLEKRLLDTSVSPFTPIPLAEDVTEQQMVSIRERQEDFPGVVARTVAVRHYPHGSLAAHVLGYVGGADPDEIAASGGLYDLGDQIGKAGVERAYDAELRGVDGTERIEVDRTGTPVRTILPRQPPVQGHDIVLSIDIDVQARAEAALRQGLDNARGLPFSDDKRPLKADAGAVVAIDAVEGTITAMASYPTFDLPGIADGISQAEFARLYPADKSQAAPFVNRALQGQYAPGSTWKLVTADAAMRTKLVPPNYTYDDPGFFEIQECTGASCIRRNAGSKAFGRVDFRRALSVSSDVYFYNLGSRFWQQHDRYGETPIQDSAALLGFGSDTGVPLPDEKDGRVPTPASRKELHRLKPNLFPTGGWFEGDNVNLAIGQGELGVTPIQLASAYGTYANGGTRFALNIALRVQRQDGTVVRSIGPRVLSHVDIRPEVRQTIMAGLAGAVAHPDGTAYNAFRSFPLSRYGIAGKTGTAQAKPKQDTAIFVGLGPTSSPRHVVSVVMEQSGFGASAAAPVARRVFASIAKVDEGNEAATFAPLNGAGD